MNPLPLDNIADRHLGRMLELQAQQNGATEYLITDDVRISFAEADDITNRLATGFLNLGVARGDRVCLYMSNVPELVLLCLALNKIGAVWVPICTDYKGDWLLDSIQRSEAKALVTDQAQLERVVAIKSGLDAERLILLDGSTDEFTDVIPYADLLNNDVYRFDYTEHHYGDSSAILWTSGTTGRSKGVMQAHNNWVHATLDGAGIMYSLQPDDIVYCALPLYNSGGWLTCVIRALISGIGCVIERKFSVSTFMERIQHFKATQTFALGAMGVFLMSQPEREGDADIPLREAAIVPMPPDMIAPFEKRFGLKILSSGFGMSECLLSLNQLHSDVELPIYSLGFPAPSVDVRLCDDDGKEVPDGQPGEVCVKALQPHVLFNGYFKEPEKTAEAYRGDWFLTGDMARKDPETGAFYFVDRKKDAVRFAGRNISTLEVENVVRRHPAIKDVAAFGIPSVELDSEDELKLNIIFEEGESAEPEQICGFINEIAPHYFVPRYMEFVTELPYTPTNKVQKYVLRQAGVTSATWDVKKSSYKIEK